MISLNLKKTPETTLDELLRSAAGIEVERQAALARIAKLESQISDTSAEIGDAKQRLSAEEFEAAKAGRLAVGTDQTERAISDAELRLKTLHLQLQHQQSVLGEIVARYLAAWPEIEAGIAGFKRQRVAEVAAEIDAAIEALGTALARAAAIHRFKGLDEGEQTCLFRAIATLRIGNPLHFGKSFQLGALCEGTDMANRRAVDNWPSKIPQAQDLFDKLSELQAKTAPAAEIARQLGATKPQ